MPFEPATIITSALTGAVFGTATSILIQGRSRWMESRSYASALAREVLSNAHKLAAWREQIQADQAAAAGSRDRSDAMVMALSCPLSVDDMLIFRSSIVGIGRLPPWLVLRVMKLYDWFRELQESYRQPLELDPNLARELIERLDEILRYIDGRVFTELEVIAVTPYWWKLRFEFEAWRSERTKEEYRNQ